MHRYASIPRPHQIFTLLFRRDVNFWEDKMPFYRVILLCTWTWNKWTIIISIKNRFLQFWFHFEFGLLLSHFEFQEDDMRWYYIPTYVIMINIHIPRVHVGYDEWALLTQETPNLQSSSTIFSRKMWFSNCSFLLTLYDMQCGD